MHVEAKLSYLRERKERHVHLEFWLVYSVSLHGRPLSGVTHCGPMCYVCRALVNRVMGLCESELQGLPLKRSI